MAYQKRLIKAYKLFRVRKDGTLGPLFIDRTLRVPTKRWLKARAIHKTGFAFHPGWHAVSAPRAPHLAMAPASGETRRWFEVQLRTTGLVLDNRPQHQGGQWYQAQWMRVVRELTQSEHRIARML
jgi:hypothetical protein